VIFFTFNTNTVRPSRGHPYKLYVHHNRLNVRKQFFSCRVVWNSLPAERINFSSLTSFRLSLLNVDFSKFLTIDCSLFGALL